MQVFKRVGGSGLPTYLTVFTLMLALTYLRWEIMTTMITVINILTITIITAITITITRRGEW